MGDLKVSEGFLDAVMIRTASGAAATGLSPTCYVTNLSTGIRTQLTVAEVGNGIYKVIDWAPATKTEYITEWAVVGPYTIYSPYKLFKVGGGRTEDIHDIVKAGGTGDLAAVLGDTAELQADWHDGGRLDLIIDAVATAVALATVDSIVDAILEDTGTTLPATLATIAGYLDTEIAAILAAVDTEVAAIKAKTDGLPSDPADDSDIDAQLIVIDGFHDVPAADAVTNAQMRDVPGQKGDSAQYTIGGGSSLMRYIKANNTAMWGLTGFTASASTVNSITAVELADIASKYIGRVIVPLSGNMAGEGRIISAYDGTQTLTVHRAWPEAPGNVAFIVMSNPLGDLFYGAKGLEAIYDLADAILDLTPTDDTVTLSGAEQNMYINDAPSGAFEPRVLKVDFSGLGAGDAVRIRIYERIKTGGAYGLPYYDETFSNAQTVSFDHELRPNRWGIKTTVQRTAGALATIDWEVMYNG